MTDLAFSELPFLNQSVKKPPQSRLLHKQDSSAYKPALQDDVPSKMVPSDTQNAQPEHAPTRPTRNDENQRFTRTESECCTLSLSPERMDIRPRSPKQRNFGMAPAPKSGMAVNVTHSDKTVEQVQDQSEVSCNAAHHKQGLSLESRQVGARAFVPSQQSVGATPSRTSHHLSTIAESGQLSSLTGLSAGSLVRRRLLRRMEESYTETVPHASRQNLEAELRAFRSAEELGQQLHGPSAKTGAAVIPRNNMAPIPDLPAPTPPRLKALVPVTSQQRRIAYHQAENRSPDWFASKASAATGADFNDVYVQAGSFRYPRSVIAAQSQVSHLDFIEDPSYIQLGDNFSPIAFPAYAGKPYDAQSYQEQRYQHSHIRDGYAFPSPPQAPHVSQSFPLPLTTPQLQAESQQFAEVHRISPYQHAAVASLHGDPYQPAEQPSPQQPLLYSHTTAHFPQDFEDPDFADDAARFQRGRADLHNYIPEPPCRAPLQTLQGFWYRNNL